MAQENEILAGENLPEAPLNREESEGIAKDCPSRAMMNGVLRSWMANIHTLPPVQMKIS